MGYDGKYGRVTTEFGDIPPDEPVIVFRSRDALLPRLLEEYRRLCEAAGSPDRHLRLIDQARGSVLAWQRLNRGAVKVPDSERSRAWMSDDLVPPAS